MKLTARLAALAITVLPFASAAQTAPSVECKPQTKIDVRIIKRQIIVIGERHGTEQVPAFVSGLVCSLLKNGRSVILALEMESSEQAALNAFIDSAGSAADRQALLAQGNWTWATDGRTSSSMLTLIDDMRALRRAGQRVGVMTMQGSNPGIKIPQRDDELLPVPEADNQLHNRINDRMMADRLASAAMHYRKYSIVALAGFAHTSTKQIIRSDPMLLPAGQLLAAMEPAFFIGLKSSEGGESWRVGKEGSKAYAVAPGKMYAEGTQIDAEVELGKLSASPPAKTAQ